MKVTDIMSRPVITVSPETPVKEAARLLVERGISALPVVDTRGALVGIVSEADLMPMQTRPDPRSQATPLRPSAGTTPGSVADVMTRKVLTLPAGSEVSQAARAILEAGVKRMPVMRGKKLVGIVSRRDLMRVIARTDESLRGEVNRRLHELGVLAAGSEVKVESGVVTIAGAGSERERALVESVTLAVPGVLEVRFAPPRVLKV
ncbi:MAG TPA: CBS domain-containing protein [Candidatus Dormibacteraeota bacterium]|nr:CBS domain-containing protein [Candidatus Dormibacteraeota bacterium]